MATPQIPVPKDVVEATPKTEFQSYLKVVRNSVGSNMFRNFYVLKNGELYDALHDGGRSCGFFVSAILTIFKKIDSFHNTVYSTVKHMKDFGWQEVTDLKPGDVIVWEAEELETGSYAHIGFYIGDGEAISTSDETGTPILHHEHPNHKWSTIARVYRLPQWEFGTRAAPPSVDNPDPV